jgi:hypothetical protein
LPRSGGFQERFGVSDERWSVWPMRCPGPLSIVRLTAARALNGRVRALPYGPVRLSGMIRTESGLVHVIARS